ncbi:MAG: hypothetical protein ACRDCE_04625 [Cetobacterium sp.]|uniref:hypothetical protein n=1 Tax=Cetobacterium sp. TaxID=2071632 RepID=UPI003EE42BCD
MCNKLEALKKLVKYLNDNKVGVVTYKEDVVSAGVVLIPAGWTGFDLPIPLLKRANEIIEDCMHVMLTTGDRTLVDYYFNNYNYFNEKV